MAIKFTNNASGTLATSINNSTTSISLSSGNGALFPSLSGSDFFYATLVDSSNNLEIIKVTARSTDSLTVVRGQGGTTARAYSAADKLELRPVAEAFNEFVQLTGTQTISGDKTFSGTNSFTGSVSFSNTITGSISGNAATVTNGVYTNTTQTISGSKTFSAQVTVGNGSANMYLSTFAGSSNYNIEQGWDDTGLFWNVSSTVRGVRWIKNGSSNLASLDSSGNFTALANVTAYSDERLKSEIKTIEGALDSVKAMRGASFKRDGKYSVGVIAQEVQKVYPEVVHENDDGYLSVAYGNLVGVLIEAVKELTTKVEALEAK